MSKIIKIAAMFVAGFIVITTSGCASIIKGQIQQVSVNSTPAAAQIVVLDNMQNIVQTGITPTTLILKRGAGFFTRARYTVQITKEGYAPLDIPLTGRANGWYIGGNFIFGGLIGWLIVDPATGSMWTLSPEEINTTMSSAQSSIWHHNHGFTVVLKEQVPEELLACMQSVMVN